MKAIKTFFNNLFKDNESILKNKTQSGASDCVILFVKADRGANVIKSIKEEAMLFPAIAEPLYAATHKLWIGNKANLQNSNICNVFNFSGEQSEFGPEYDSIAILINIDKALNADVSDSFQIHQFILSLCTSNNICDKISNRLPLTTIEQYELISV